MADRPHDAATLVEILRHRAQRQPDQMAYTFLLDGETKTASVTYRELDQRARAIAANLQAESAPGDRALLLYPSGSAYVTAFWACLYAGIIAVPAYPPHAKRPPTRLRAIIQNAQPRWVLTTQELAPKLKAGFNDRPDLVPRVYLPTDTIEPMQADAWQEPECRAESLAYLQYTSGSTAAPKGVMISHANLLATLIDLDRSCHHNADSVMVTWLPLFHDMGLIYGILEPLYLGFPCYVMSPTRFLQRPGRWLQAITRYQGTHSAAPNFAYDLCVTKMSAAEYADLDLRSWRMAFNAAEPIRAETLNRFTHRFAPVGFSAHTFTPGYGLAEATLKVTALHWSEPPLSCDVSTEALNQHRVEHVDLGQVAAQTLIGCGHSEIGTDIRIVHPETRCECAADEVGEIWVAGPSVAQGYWQASEATAATFHARLADTDAGPFLRTGDLGFVHDDQVFITGRLDDMIIIRGRNYYPQDIELTVGQCHPALALDRSAAFSIDVEGQAQLVVAQEVKRPYLRTLNSKEIAACIRRAVVDEHDLHVYAIALLKPATILKTSSGKIQRRACRDAFLQGALTVVHLDQPHVKTPRHTMALAPADVSSTSSTRADELIQWLRHYAHRHINSRLIDERRSIPPSIVLDFGNQGLLGLQIPKLYGGLALSHHDTLRVFEQLSAIDLTLTLFVANHHILGARPILHHAQPAIRDTYLPLMAQGRQLAAFALTEPGAGSNPRAISTRAVPSGANQWRLYGQKIWIGSGAWASVINVFAQVEDPYGQPLGITGFVVPQDAIGLDHGPEALTMGMRGMVQNRINLNGVQVGTEQVLGQVGQGMQVAMEAMMFGRLGIGAMSVGGMKRCAQLMLRYAQRRSVSSGLLLNNPVTIARLGDLNAAITALETLTITIAVQLDAGLAVPDEVYTVCKIAGPEFLWQAADQLVQLLGGRGVIETNIAPQLLRDARLLRIFEGPTETLTAFLGSSLFHNPTTMQQFLVENLSTIEVADHLHRAVVQLTDPDHVSQAARSDPASARHWTYFHLGDIATFAILWAVVQEAYDRLGTDRLLQAVTWARRHFEQRIAQALASHSTLSSSSSVKAVVEMIDRYTDTIGQVEQTLPGEDHTLDALLHLAQPVSSPTHHFPPSLSSVETPRADQAQLFAASTIQSWLIDWLSQKLGVPAETIHPRQAFADYGLDSILAVALIQDVEDQFGLHDLEMESTLVWSYPTLDTLASYLAHAIHGPTEPPAAPRSASPVTSPHEQSSGKTTQTPQLTPAASPEALESLSESELAALLATELSTIKRRRS